MGRLLGTTTNYSFLTSRSFTTAYTYDAASNRTGFTDPESGSTTYAYDTLNRLTTLTPPSAFTTGSFGFSYDALSRRTQMTRPNNVTSIYGYDNLSHLTGVLHQLSGSTIDGTTYTLDNVGNRMQKNDQSTGFVSNYNYDSIYQLGGVVPVQLTPVIESYTYDAVGNRTSSLGVASYTNNVSNELTSTSNASYTYDTNGNTLSKTVGSDTTTYAWDFENRLTSVTLPGTGGTVSFRYDPFGRRIYKSSSSGTSAFAYDGDNLTEETNSSGAFVARYAQTQNIDEPLAMLRSSTTSYYQADGLGSVTSLSNAAGALAQTYTFDSFGNQTASAGSLTNPFRYTGRESDSETGLYYYRARYYDPSTGRFLSEDPIRFRGGSVNLYSYTRNSASNYADPSGNIPAVGAIPILVGGGVSAATLGTGALVVGVTGLAVYDGLLAGKLIDAEIKSCDWCRRLLHPHPETVIPPAPAKPIPICNTPGFPGWDPTRAPGKGWEWRGKPPVGGREGGWFNPDTDESLHPDLNHPDPIGPHWDYIDPSGNPWRIFPDGTATPK